MSKLVGRKSIEININDLKNGHIPIYDKERGLWYTTSTSSIAQGISGSKLELSEITASSLLITSDAYIQGRLTAIEYYSTVISSSIIYQSGSTKFGDTLDDTHQFTGSILVDGNIEAPSITGSFKGDGSQLTGLVTDLRISGSTGTDIVSLLTDDLTITGINGITTTVTDNVITIDVPVALTSSLFGTASFATIAENITVIDAGIYTTGSDSVIIPMPSGGLTYITSASHALFADVANLYGTTGYVPVWKSPTTVSESILYQTESGIRILAQNNSVFQFGVNDHNVLQNGVGSPYLIATGSDLLIGNISDDQRIVFFTGGTDVATYARMFINVQGTIGLNSTETTTGFPETLFIRALNDNTYNLVTAKSNVDAYSQINVQNESTGAYASTDIVATADNGDEKGYFINIGINGSQYIGDFNGDYGHNGDAYLYNTGSHLHIGNATPNNLVSFFAGGTDFDAHEKLVLRANDQHSLKGNLDVTGSLTISGSATLKNIGPTIFSGSLNVTNGITGSINYANIIEVPEGLVSSSNQIVAALPSGLFSSSAQLPAGTISSSTQVVDSLPAGLVSSSEQINTGSFSGSFIGTLSGTIESASHATTASYALAATAQVPDGTVSSSLQVDYNQIQNQPIIIATASYIDYTNVVNKPTLVSASSQVSYIQLANVPSGLVSSSAQLPAGTVSSSTQVLNYNTFATTGSNTFTANQTITGSLTITSNLIVQGSSSISYVSQSTLNIGTNMVTVNAQNPSVRFGGLAVIDSASSPQVSGSLLFDSIENQWLYVHQNQANITSSILLMGPQTYNNVGNETHPTTNRLMKSLNDEHLGDSQISDDGTTVSIPGNLTVTGIVSGSQFSGRMTGSLLGTATTASYVTPAGLPSGLVSGSTQISQFGNIRLTVGTTNKNSGAAFYFNSNTVTSGDSSTPGQDTAFLIQSTGLSTVTVHLRQSAAGPNATIVGVAKNANGTAFSSATLVTSSSLSLSANTIQTYTFSGLTLNQFDAIHIYVDPTNAPTDMFGVVLVS